MEINENSKYERIKKIEKKYKMIAENVTISYGGIVAVKNITMKFPEKSVS